MDCKKRSKVDKSPLFTPDVFIIIEKVYYSEEGVQWNEGKGIGVGPSGKRIVKRNPGDKRGRDKFVRRGPKDDTVS
jgi:hypothetical protein